MERKIILALLGFGMLITLSGFLLLLLPKEFLKNNMRFITPLPPIAVAVYVYISKAVELKFDTTASFLYEIVRMSFFVGALYFVFALLLFLFVKNA
jgi:hypothetical protein